MKSFSKTYWKKLIIALILFILINYVYFFEIINMNINFPNLMFLILVDILIFMTILCDYIL